LKGYSFDAEFQDKMAALIIRDTRLLTTIRSVIDPRYFTDPANRAIVKQAIRFFRKYKQSPTRDEFLAFVSKSLSTNEIMKTKRLFKIKLKNTEFIKNQIVEFAQYSAVRKAIIDSADLVDSFDNRMKIRSLVQQALQVGVDSADLGSRMVTELSERLVQRELVGIDQYKVSTGIKKLDRIMEGGLDAGELGLIMAPPKGFKTGTMVNFAAAALAQRKKVLIYTMEVSQDRYMMRMERRISGMTRKELLKNDDKLEKHINTIGRLGSDVIIKGYPMRSVTPSHLNNHIDLLNSEGYVPDIIFIDYWDLLKNDLFGEYRHQLATIGAELRGIAQERNVPIWTASQVNRKAVSKKIIRKEDIAEAFEKMAIVDFALAICQTPEERSLEPAQARLFVSASREVEEAGLIPVTIDYPRLRIRELQESED